MQKRVSESLATLFSKAPICDSCIRKLEADFYCFNFNGVKGLSLYFYNEFMQKQLNNLKVLNDIEIARQLLKNYQLYLKYKYKKEVIVFAPTSKESFERRGFNPVEEIFAFMNNKKLHLFEKVQDFKQSEYDFEERQKVVNKIRIVGGQSISGADVLIIDDIITTGATIKAMISMIKKHKPKSIKILTLTHTMDKKQYLKKQKRSNKST